MRIEAPEVKTTVTDYDVTFDSGIVIPFTINPAIGDTLKATDKMLFVHLAAKPSITDSSEVIPEQEITIFLDKAISIHQRTRTVVELQPEAKADLERAWKEFKAHPTVQ